MTNNLDETLNKILGKLNEIEEKQLNIIQQMELPTNRVENSSLIQTNSENLKRQAQQIDFLLHKVSLLEEEIFILKKSRAIGK